VLNDLAVPTAVGPATGENAWAPRVAQGLLRLCRGGAMLASFQAEWRHFSDAIQNDTPVECTLENGRRALLIVLAATRSAALNRPVKVAELSEPSVRPPV
jgi:predicted dehydrogenase